MEIFLKRGPSPLVTPRLAGLPVPSRHMTKCNKYYSFFCNISSYGDSLYMSI